MKVFIDDVEYVPRRMFPERSTLGKCLKALRVSSGESLDTASAMIVVSKTYLWELENDKADNPSFPVMVRVAKHYGVSLDSMADKMS